MPNLKNLSRGWNFETRIEYGWFHLNLYSMFQDLIQRLIETGFSWIWDAAQVH